MWESPKSSFYYETGNIFLIRVVKRLFWGFWKYLTNTDNINGAQHRGDKSQCTRCIQNIEFRWKMCTGLCDTCARKKLKVRLNESHSCKLSHEISKCMTVSDCSYTLTKKDDVNMRNLLLLDHKTGSPRSQLSAGGKIYASVAGCMSKVSFGKMLNPKFLWMAAPPAGEWSEYAAYLLVSRLATSQFVWMRHIMQQKCKSIGLNAASSSSADRGLTLTLPVGAVFVVLGLLIWVM